MTDHHKGERNELKRTNDPRLVAVVYLLLPKE